VHDPLLVLVAATAVGTATPLLLAALGETVIERSGVLNLGVEGMMLIAALTAFWGSTRSGNPWYGILAAALVTAAVGAMYAAVTVSLGCDQIVAGLALNIIAFGLTSYLGRKLVGVPPSDVLQPVALPLLADLPVLGTIFFRQPIMAYATFLFVPALTIFLFATRWGLNLRAVGESPNTADAAGISVVTYRYFATIAGAGIIGLAGAHLSTSIAPAWTDNLTAGRGWIALALVIFGGWNPVKVLVGALLFGVVEALSYHAQALNLPVSSYFLQAMPYAFTVIVLALGAQYSRRRRLGAPAALGLFWQRG
jgi:general nucleoside transport system permease protein